MEIISFETLPSTQTYLIDAINSKTAEPPICVISDIQTDGIGSRDNNWVYEEGSLFASVCLPNEMLPDDLPIQSASIYFGQMMKEVLVKLNKDIWLKWPNDLYLDDKKIGGIITNSVQGCLVCGVGVNMGLNNKYFASLVTDKTPYFILENFLKVIEKKPNWKQILSNVRIEFSRNKNYFAHTLFGKKSLEGALLCEDGSLDINGERVYSLR
ncbi:MAG: biotin--[acetyl-CoA-carboxylase] ligase [Sulfurovaceae bacterium]|nr:biotin--[acetyl-CoA-carboxylase] ligase [Sulfurovaceae bacterium]MDD5548025.1 biotin--[acetyl-CoA-carboxylase] ligase [Sulfurovaceae bacterium]